MGSDEKSSDQIKGERSQKPGVSSPVIPVIEEQVQIGRKVVEAGRVHISKKVIEEDYNAEIPVFNEEIVMVRKQFDEYIDGEVPVIRRVGDTTIIPVIKEVIVKRLMLVEELHITKRTSEHSVPVHETLRREEVTVNRSDKDGTTRDFNK